MNLFEPLESNYESQFDSRGAALGTSESDKALCRDGLFLRAQKYCSLKATGVEGTGVSRVFVARAEAHAHSQSPVLISRKASRRREAPIATVAAQFSFSDSDHTQSIKAIM